MEAQTGDSPPAKQPKLEDCVTSPKTRKSYTTAFKLKMVEKVKAGSTLTSVSREENIPVNSLCVWVKSHEKLKTLAPKAFRSKREGRYDDLFAGFRRLILPESVVSDSKGPQAPGTLQPQTPKPFISTNIFTRYQARQMRKLEKHMAREEKRASRRERKAKKRERDDYAYVEDIIALLDDNRDADNANVEEK